MSSVSSNDTKKALLSFLPVPTCDVNFRGFSALVIRRHGGISWRRFWRVPHFYPRVHLRDLSHDITCLLVHIEYSCRVSMLKTSDAQQGRREILIIFFTHHLTKRGIASNVSLGKGKGR